MSGVRRGGRAKGGQQAAAGSPSPSPAAGAGREVAARAKREAGARPPKAASAADPAPADLALQAYADITKLSPSAIAQLDPLGFWRRPSPTPGQMAITRSVLAHLLRGVGEVAKPHPGEGPEEKNDRWFKLAAALDSGDLSAARTAAQWLAYHDQDSQRGSRASLDAQFSALALASRAADQHLPLVATLDLVFGLLPLTGRDPAQEFSDGLSRDEPPPPGYAEEKLLEVQLAEEALSRQVGRLRHIAR